MRVLATHSIRQFPLHFPSRASPCATRFRTSSSTQAGKSESSIFAENEGFRVKRFRFDLAVAKKPFVLEDQRLKTLCMNMTVCECGRKRGKERVIWQELNRTTTTMNRGWMGPNNEL